MSYTLDQYKSRKELLTALIKDLDKTIEENSTLVHAFFGQNTKVKCKCEASIWLKNILNSKLKHVEDLISDFDK